ncbi:(2Fe-2S)-binding protein [Paracraurococcus ruber]|uniref:(2Fe-2S)-binding protein n=1 Tax=Paracraurococcus ruber TaxID=77675 RepID=A0ABS1D7E0_9PROT|nr:(2Fe-2S)-binding protein [Paracraurococcus ruber]MBK1661789.1 (2Fe-2S)-binding protein [Paracraurococcus ruber]TDG17573.1 (2Fe-2S)-binding protein [Paracraurococcus ruber]
MIEITVNGRTQRVDAEPDTPLLWVLRDWLGMTGTKYGCGIAQCGACSVLVDGQPMRSCQVPVESVVGQPVLTIEAMADHPVGRKVVEAWVAQQVPQCGYCQSGQVIAATGLLLQTPKPSAEDVADAMTNLCRCGTYLDIAAAVRRAADAA